MPNYPRRVSKVINLTAGICLLLGMSYCTYIFGTAETRVKKLCPQMIGMPFDELTVFGQRHGMNKPSTKNGTTIMVEIKSYGRWGCMVEMKNGKAIHVEYSFLD